MLVYILSSVNMSPEQAVLLFVITVLVFAFSLSLHEFAHAFVAYKMGDITAKSQGRMTINPIKHIDFMGFICFMLVGVGWAKPTPINPLKFKHYRKGIRFVSLAGIIANILLGLLSAGIYAILYNVVGVPNTAMEYVYLLLDAFMLINSYLALFNLLPIYPFDGFNFVSSFCRSDNKFVQFSIKNGMKIILIVLFVDLIFSLFGIELIASYLSILYNYVFVPIACL